MTQLQATLRDQNITLDALRAAGTIPAVIYGSGISESMHVGVDRELFKKAWKAAGSSTAVTLSIDGKNHDVLIHDFQVDPKTDMVIHADFLVLNKLVKVTVSVELEFVGVSPAVKSGLGILEKTLHEIEIEALPKDLPKNIEVDISGLESIHDQIHVKDLKIAPGIEVKTGADEVVAVIGGLQEEVESTGEIDLESIEVEKKGKKDDEDSAE
jgi:large subunit ribosomal protein L25